MELDTEQLRRRYLQVRAFSEQICEPLETEDYVVQSMAEASPAKWHLGHTSWFFEHFILVELLGRKPLHEGYRYLFNSYYNGAGDQYARARRGLLTRPTVEDVYGYRSAVDEQIAHILGGGSVDASVRQRVQVGLNHEQQHQELLLTDLKHLLAQNPMYPAVFPGQSADLAAGDDGSTTDASRSMSPARHAVDGGVYQIGAPADGFAYDNERPRHEVLIRPFELAARPVTCAEYLDFIEDGGYQRPQPWLADGWARVQKQGWTHPLYWQKKDGRWHQFTLAGLRPIKPQQPVVHVSYYEADAFARWAGARLPSEQEWEIVGADQVVAGNFVESGQFHPTPVDPDEPAGAVAQMFGDVWEWTTSAYGPYPGFEPLEGALGEYNGKFMCNQQVLRGGSCATSQRHMRPSYRNFFYPQARWQFSGIRLAW